MRSSNGGCFPIVLIGLSIFGLLAGFVFFASPASSKQIDATAAHKGDSWRDYANTPQNGDVMTQLNSAQALVSALEFDLYLSEQKVNLSEALGVLQKQLQNARRQVEQEQRSQSIRQWGMTCAGLFIGWLVGMILPFRSLFGKFKAEQSIEESAVGEAASDSGSGLLVALSILLFLVSLGVVYIVYMLGYQA